MARSGSADPSTVAANLAVNPPPADGGSARRSRVRPPLRRTRAPALVRWQRYIVVGVPLVFIGVWLLAVTVLFNSPWWAIPVAASGALVGLLLRTRPRRRSFLVPRDLPPPPRVFVGREAQLRKLASCLEAPAPAGSRLMVIAGEAGVGKTTLALEAAHRVARLFPDGQLFGRFGAPRRTAEAELRPVVRELVAALKRPGETVPDDLPDALGRYEWLVATGRVLVILDNVHRIEDIRRLRPGGRGSAMIVTTRHAWREEQYREEGLRPDCYVDLGRLSDADGLEFLRRMIDPKRIEDEQRDALEVVRATGGLPLALQVAAVHLRHRPHTSLARAVERIRSGRPAKVSRADQPLAGVLPLLSKRERHALKLLGVLGKRELTSWRLAALLDPPAGLQAREEDESDAQERAAARIIDRLVLLGLVERSREDAAGVPRFQINDSVQAYAANLVERESDDWRARYDERLQQAEDARTWAAPAIGEVYRMFAQGRLRRAINAARRALALAEDQADAGSQALAYAALAEIHAELGGVEEARDLAVAAMKFPDEGGPAKPRALRCIGKTHRRLRQIEAAAAHLDEALKATNDDTSERIRVLRELAIAYALGTEPKRGWAPIGKAEQLLEGVGADARMRPGLLAAKAAVAKGLAGRETDPERRRTLLGQAEQWLDEAISRAGEFDLYLSLAWMSQLYGQIALLGGRSDDARAHARQALTRFNSMRHRYGVAHCRLLFGRAYLEEGRLDEARIALEEALEGFGSCGDRWAEAQASQVLARVHARNGEKHQAVQLLVGAQRIFFSLGDRLRWQRARDELDALSSPLRRPFLQAELVPDPVAAWSVAVGTGGNR